MTEPLDSHQLARLALEAAPHLDLLKRIGRNLDTVLRMAAVTQDWSEIDAALQTASTAPEALRATFHRATFEHYGRLHGLNAEVIGALAHERRKGPVLTAAPSTSPTTGLPVLPRPVGPVDAEHVALLEELQRRLLAMPGTVQDVIDACAALGAKFSHSQLSGIRGGSIVRNAQAGYKGGGTMAPQTARELKAALDILTEPHRVEEAPAPETAAPPAAEPPAPQVAPQAPCEPPPAAPVNAALLTSTKERVRFIRDQARANDGVVRASEIKHALCLSYGAAVQLIKDIPGIRVLGGDLYRIPL